ncbi:MAG: YegS/Rv2252/BmrU family lipid kinase [Chloroflexi bacterium]|jgi:YegS/Rv2252/BmrU family lipid kinase|nr:YegS/Rv2252/BmrU family lipid kinase [Chloroflexota bacterium]
MKDKSVYLHMAVFDGLKSADMALAQLPRRDPSVVSAVVMEKDDAENVQFKDVGLTPGKGAVGGVVIGGVIGLLTGGAGLALGALGGLAGHRVARKRQAQELAPDYLSKVAGSLGPDSSAIIAVSEKETEPEIKAALKEMGAEIFEAIIPPETSGQLDENAEAAYATMLEALAQKTGGQAKMDVPYRRIHVVLNPVSGKDQPILNVLNRVFYRYGIDWEISITKKYGDATRFARQAAEAGFDLVAGYGGDGTQHEIANGVMGTGVPMGVLPGGTGNGFGNELGVPKVLEPAVELLCTSHNQRKIDIAQVEEGYFVQRLFTGIEPDEQTSREEKDKYGTFAYLVRDVRRMKEIQDIPYKLRIDGEEIEVMGYKCYVVNSATAGTGMSISREFAVDDGYLDVFMLSRDRKSSQAALERFFNLKTEKAGMYYWRGQEIEIDAGVDQPVWTDGEYTGRTPVSIKVQPRGLTVAVP